ncbi:DUF3995 domain-containing protein [Bdellovibrio sp. HCB2-146]|uniref:DUF3995 domain-containing protein n=1 Tax=Bdellovibrio sp. HCB2-146 TaxID=3394362 RepID=UPI0039BD1B58
MVEIGREPIGKVLLIKYLVSGNQFPSIYSCYFVASILILAGIVPLFTENILFGTRFNNYSWFNFFIALPLMIRGVGGNLPMIEKRWTQVFVRNNRIIYSPLCIVLALSYILFGL